MQSCTYSPRHKLSSIYYASSYGVEKIENITKRKSHIDVTHDVHQAETLREKTPLFGPFQSSVMRAWMLHVRSWRKRLKWDQWINDDRILHRTMSATAAELSRLYQVLAGPLPAKLLLWARARQEQAVPAHGRDSDVFGCVGKESVASPQRRREKWQAVLQDEHRVTPYTNDCNYITVL
jgi:hypothetical protein